MTISSMTGFARIEGAHSGWTWAWEARSVNGRGLDIRLRIPSGFESLETEVRNAAKAALRRGNIQINLQYQRSQESQDLVVHEEVARHLVMALQPLVDDGLARAARIDGLLGVRGVLDVPRIGDDPAMLRAIESAMSAGIEPLMNALGDARANEGMQTALVIGSAFDEIEELVAKARACDSAQGAAIKARLSEQIKVLLAGQDFDADRLAQEAALMAVKADVREELDRLSAHIGAGRALLNEVGPVGRKMEFLAQEFNREANTLCSKSSDMALTEIGLALKTRIDQVREQAANVE